MNKLAGLTFLMLMLLGSSIKATGMVKATYDTSPEFCIRMVKQGRDLFESSNFYKEMANNYYGSFLVVTYITEESCHPVNPFNESPEVSFHAASFQMIDGKTYVNEDRIINYNYQTGSFCK